MGSVKRIIDKCIDIVAGVAMGIVFLVTFLQVISRYAFQLNIPWSTDIIRLTFIYTVFFGAAIGMKEKGHLSMDILMSVLPKRAQIVLGLGINAVLIAFLVFVVRYGIQFTLGALTQNMPYLNMPISVLYAAIPVTAVLMIFYLVLNIGEQIGELKHTKA